MSFSALSVVLSASEDRLPRQHLADLAKCLDLMSESGKRRRRIVSEHSNVHTARVLFEQIETLPKGSLLTVIRFHGLDLISGVITPVTHYVPQSGNMLVLFNFGPGGGIEDPSIRMQVRILRQLGPVLKTNPLRRLLELHNVPYIESDNCKRLRTFLDRLETGHDAGCELGKVHFFVQNGRNSFRIISNGNCCRILNSKYRPNLLLLFYVEGQMKRTMPTKFLRPDDGDLMDVDEDLRILVEPECGERDSAGRVSADAQAAHLEPAGELAD
ncbi:hypothetical protein DFH09DRAFT_1096235 [Mycena vulgaris]|nr:hypothetical protein DFH09DRAFT_1096235 [Mycena vulgaris]